MSDIAIKVENLSKKYTIGLAQQKHDTLRDLLVDAVRAPFRSNGKARQEQSTLWALKDVSFEVKRGEVVGIIGRNGAGKSTLLKILSRITEPTSGRAIINGRVRSLLEVGTGFHQELTGRENIYLNGAILGMRRSEIERKFDEIVDFAEIEKFLDTPVKRYSSGMYVRLAFAVAANLEPEILLVDEVLAVGDAGFQKKCLGKMGDAGKQGRTVLFVSHNMAAVAQLCSRSIWLENGSIKGIDISSNVIKNYLSKNFSNKADVDFSKLSRPMGDNLVRLLGLRLIQNNTVTSIVDINYPCEVEIDFEILASVRNFITGISVKNQEGVMIFVCDDWRPNSLKPGKYRKSAIIPAQFLAEGNFNIGINLHFYEIQKQSVSLDGALSFETIDSDHPLSIRGLYKGTWPGVVRIFLKWSDTTDLGISNIGF